MLWTIHEFARIVRNREGVHATLSEPAIGEGASEQSVVSNDVLRTGKRIGSIRCSFAADVTDQLVRVPTGDDLPESAAHFEKSASHRRGP